MKVNNSLVSKQKPKAPSFSMIINSQSMQSMISKTLNDPRRAASFTASLISAVSASEQLAKCKPESIVSAALSGEAMDLSLRLGQYSIVPYGDTANYQISYKGLSQLAVRSGLYKRLQVQDVREGEYLGEDPDTWEPIIRRIPNGRESLPLAGIRAMYELTNGFRNVLYWDHEKILNHADRYSQAFSKAKYEQMLNGELSPDEVNRIQRGSPWYGEPLSEQHLKMCRKTVMIQLLNDGIAPLSIEMRMAIDNDSEQERGGAVIFPDDPAVMKANAPEPEEEDVIDITPASEEPVKEEPPKQQADMPKQEAPKREAPKPKPAPRAKKEVADEPPLPMQGDLSDYMNPPENIEGLPFA